MRRTLAAIALVLGAPAALAQSPGQSEVKTADAQVARSWRDAAVKLEKARAAFEKKDYEKARTEAKAALDLAPSMPDAHLLVAKVAYLGKDYPVALEEVVAAKDGFEKSAAMRTRMQDDRVDGYRRKAREKQDSINELRIRMSQVPSDQQQQIQIQVTQLESDKLDLEKLIQEAPAVDAPVPAEYFFLHGNVLLRTKRYDEAVVQYDEALKRNPAYADAANNLASLWYSARQYGKAKAVVEKAEAAGAVLNPELKKAIEDGLGKPK